MLKKIIFTGVALALVATPLISLAQTTQTLGVSATIAGLQVQIQSLLAELQALRAQATTSVSVSGSATSSAALVGPVMPFCPSVTRSLSVGASGSDVTALQQFLSAHGYLSVSATGYFGALTQAAVAKWQAQNGVVASGGAGSGMFGPLSRSFLLRWCNGSTTSTGGTGNSTPGTLNFSASPVSGAAPLTVQFIATASQGTTLGSSVNFGDGATGNLAFVPVCSSCNAEGTATHTYTSAGTYTASLTGGACACPANDICNCPNMQILATTTITVLSTSTSSTSSIQQLNAPGSATLSPGGIAEIRNESFYFTLESLTQSSATIQITPVGCWNSFPSDTPPRIVCMIALVPIPPQTLSIGQTYNNGNDAISLTQIANGSATFSVNPSAAVQY